jgi:hypothetical protein
MRPALTPLGPSLPCVDRTAPTGGTPEDGRALDEPLHTTLLSEIAAILARHGVAPGAHLYVAEAALGSPLFIRR